MTVLVCGGRHYADRFRVYVVLDGLCPDLVVHGGATGADALAAKWCETRSVPELRVRANWTRYGKAAGPLRNARMLRIVPVDLVVAFPGGPGTRDMVARATMNGVAVRKIAADATMKEMRECQPL